MATVTLKQRIFDVVNPTINDPTDGFFNQFLRWMVSHSPSVGVFLWMVSKDMDNHMEVSKVMGDIPNSCKTRF